jgi:hypothetical protein
MYRNLATFFLKIQNSGNQKGWLKNEVEIYYFFKKESIKHPFKFFGYYPHDPCTEIWLISL